MQLTYLASPYTHPDSGIIDLRYTQTLYAVRQLMQSGEHVFSPILHCHNLAKIGGLDSDWAYWRDIDFDFIDRCDKMAVLMLNGWESSIGIAAEIKHAEEMSMQIDYIRPNY